jgi:hypothetical protein
MSALWSDATCRVEESGDVSPHSKFNTPAPPTHPQLEFTLQRVPCRTNKLKLELQQPPRFTVRLAAMGSGVNRPSAFNKARSLAAST